MKKLATLLSIFTFVLFLTSCGGDEPIDEVVEEIVVDDPNAETTAADTSSTGVFQEEVSEEPQSLQEAMQGSSTEPEVEEDGMSFCDCVKKNKKLQDIMMADDTSDEDFDKAMADLEAMKTDECKIMFAGKQNTMDDKKAHERKVRRCLGK